MGDIYFKRVNVYAIDPLNRVGVKAGTVTLFLPQADHNTWPTYGQIVNKTLVTSKWDELMAWCSNITLVTAPYITRYADYFPNLSLSNYFTGITGFNVLGYGYIGFENPETGNFVIPSSGGNLNDGWTSFERWQSGATRDYRFPGLWQTSLMSDGSGSALLPFYESTETVTIDDEDVTIFKVLGNVSISWTASGLISITYNRGNTFSGDYYMDGFNQFWGLLQPLTPGGGDDPYDNLPIPGDGTLPGGGSVSIPGFPGLTATSAGVIGLFCPSAAQMQLLADFMWTDFGGSGTTVEDILKEVVEAIKRTISNPLDYIMGLNIIPSQGLSIGGSKSVRFGFVDSGVTMPLLANQYFTVDCGSIAFDTVCGDTFLDYAPYAKFSIYLPYIGFKDVDPNDFVGHSIGVVYHGDCVTGGITAYITKDGSVMYQYSGCCALNVPLSADSWGETISGAISVATGIVAAAATPGAAGVASAGKALLKSSAANVASNPSLLSPQVMHSGAVSGGAGCMGVQYPFVIREAVNFHSTAGFNKESGYPAYYYKALSEVTGFTTVLDPHINNIPQATQGEMAEIISLLESGVIL